MQDMRPIFAMDRRSGCGKLFSASLALGRGPAQESAAEAEAENAEADLTAYARVGPSPERPAFCTGRAFSRIPSLFGKTFRAPDRYAILSGKRGVFSRSAQYGLSV